MINRSRNDQRSQIKTETRKERTNGIKKGKWIGKCKEGSGEKRLRKWPNLAHKMQRLFLTISFILQFFPPPHSESNESKEQVRIVMGHSLVRPLIRSHRSRICLLCTAHFAFALHCAHPIACSLTHSLPNSCRGKVKDCSVFFPVLIHICIVLRRCVILH